MSTLLSLFRCYAKSWQCHCQCVSGHVSNGKVDVSVLFKLLSNLFLCDCGQMEYTIRMDDVHMSYLPLAHMFERCCEVSDDATDDNYSLMLSVLQTNTFINVPSHHLFCPPFSECTLYGWRCRSLLQWWRESTFWWYENCQAHFAAWWVFSFRLMMWLLNIF